MESFASEFLLFANFWRLTFSVKDRKGMKSSVDFLGSGEVSTKVQVVGSSVAAEEGNDSENEPLVISSDLNSFISLSLSPLSSHTHGSLHHSPSLSLSLSLSPFLTYTRFVTSFSSLSLSLSPFLTYTRFVTSFSFSLSLSLPFFLTKTQTHTLSLLPSFLTNTDTLATLPSGQWAHLCVCHSATLSLSLSPVWWAILSLIRLTLLLVSINAECVEAEGC